MQIEISISVPWCHGRTPVMPPVSNEEQAALITPNTGASTSTGSRLSKQPSRVSAKPDRVFHNLWTLPLPMPQTAVGAGGADFDVEEPVSTPIRSESPVTCQPSSQFHRQPPVLDVPAWVRAPSRYQQYWTRYTLYGAVVAYGVLFLYRCDLATDTSPRKGFLCTHKTTLQLWTPLQHDPEFDASNRMSMPGRVSSCPLRAPCLPIPVHLQVNNSQVVWCCGSIAS